MAIDVARWLQHLGLEQYEPAFRDNEVDGNVLPDLTAEDLLGLGVEGHRRKRRGKPLRGLTFRRGAARRAR